MKEPSPFSGWRYTIKGKVQIRSPIFLRNNTPRWQNYELSIPKRVYEHIFLPRYRHHSHWGGAHLPLHSNILLTTYSLPKMTRVFMNKRWSACIRTSYRHSSTSRTFMRSPMFSLIQIIVTWLVFHKRVMVWHLQLSGGYEHEEKSGIPPTIKWSIAPYRINNELRTLISNHDNVHKNSVITDVGIRITIIIFTHKREGVIPAHAMGQGERPKYIWSLAHVKRV